MVLTMVSKASIQCPLNPEYAILLFACGFSGGQVLLLWSVRIKLICCWLQFIFSFKFILAPQQYSWVPYSLHHLPLHPIRFSKVHPTFFPSLGWFHVGLVWFSLRFLPCVQQQLLDFCPCSYSKLRFFCSYGPVVSEADWREPRLLLILGLGSVKA